MTSRSRRKHRITARNLPERKPINRSPWRDYFAELGRASWTGLLAAAAVFTATSPTLADDFGRPPAQFTISDDAKPIESVNLEVNDGVGSLFPPSHQPIENTYSEKDSRPHQSSARWSNNERTIGDSSNAWKLRWRKPPVVNSSATGEEPLAVSRAVVWNKTDSKASSSFSAVRQVAQFTPVDPFEEPYPGEKKGAVTTSQAGGQPRSGQPSRPMPNSTQTQPDSTRPPLPDPFSDPNPSTPESTTPLPNEALQPMPDSLRPMPDSLRPMPESPIPRTDAAPQPPSSTEPLPDLDRAPVPPSASDGPDPLLTPKSGEKPCSRTYNSRNCCADDEKCQQARDLFSQHKLSNISLDITPSFTSTESPTSATYVPLETRKLEELGKAPSRIWKDRKGQTIAEGRFADYRNGLIHIRTADGQTKEILFNELSDDDLCFVTAWWSLPTECSLPDEVFRGRCWLASTFTWKASALCHKPLYFEEVALERYGHSVGPIKQPFVSGAHFFGSFIALPYQMGIHPPNECQYALGYYRPGSCAPWLVPPFPVSLRGALAQAGVVVGGIYIIP